MTPGQNPDHGNSNFHRKPPHPPKPGTNAFYDSAMGVNVPKPNIFEQTVEIGRGAEDSVARHNRNLPRNRRMQPYSRQESS